MTSRPPHRTQTRRSVSKVRFNKVVARGVCPVELHVCGITASDHVATTENQVECFPATSALDDADPGDERRSPRRQASGGFEHELSGLEPGSERLIVVREERRVLTELNVIGRPHDAADTRPQAYPAHRAEARAQMFDDPLVPVAIEP